MWVILKISWTNSGWVSRRVSSESVVSKKEFLIRSSRRLNAKQRRFLVSGFSSNMDASVKNTSRSVLLLESRGLGYRGCLWPKSLLGPGPR